MNLRIVSTCSDQIKMAALPFNVLGESQSNEIVREAGICTHDPGATAVTSGILF